MKIILKLSNAPVFRIYFSARGEKCNLRGGELPECGLNIIDRLLTYLNPPGGGEKNSIHIFEPEAH